MNKELSHRSHELKALGWNQEDLTRYEELWDYSQRWGLINLEREDRLFLKKAEKLLPKIQVKKNSVKKTIEEKSYYLWLDSYLEEIRKFNKTTLSDELKSVWEILIEEELNLLQKFKPVMGLPDTLKAKQLFKVRKNLIETAFSNYKAINNKKLFDFDSFLKINEKDINKSWKSIIENDPEQKKYYPIISQEKCEQFRSHSKNDIEEFMKINYPSLQESL